MRTLRTLALLTAALSASICLADWTIGSGRHFGMARAGLALPYNWVESGRLNPAIYGLAPGGFRFQMPGVSFRLQGLDFGEFQDFTGSINQGGLDEDEISLLARTLGDENVEFGAGIDLGLFLGGVMVDFGGEALAATVPNLSLQNWVDGGSAGNPPADARLDAYGLGGYEIGVAYGRQFQEPGQPSFSVGVRVKQVRNYYTHQYVDSTAIQNSGSATLASEMNGNDVLSESSIGLDLGAIISSSKTEGLFFGAVVDNLIEPKTAFQGTVPGGVPGTRTFTPYVRTFSLGAGFMTEENFMFAVDLFDVFNNTGFSELRAGLEYRLGGSLALRGGFGSRNGIALGIGLGGFNFAWSEENPGNLSYALRF